MSNELKPISPAGEVNIRLVPRVVLTEEPRGWPGVQLAKAVIAEASRETWPYPRDELQVQFKAMAETLAESPDTRQALRTPSSSGSSAIVAALSSFLACACIRCEQANTSLEQLLKDSPRAVAAMRNVEFRFEMVVGQTRWASFAETVFSAPDWDVGFEADIQATIWDPVLAHGPGVQLGVQVRAPDGRTIEATDTVYLGNTLYEENLYGIAQAVDSMTKDLQARYAELIKGVELALAVAKGEAEPDLSLPI